MHRKPSSVRDLAVSAAAALIGLAMAIIAWVFIWPVIAVMVGAQRLRRARWRRMMLPRQAGAHR